MNFITRISHSVVLATGTGLRKLRWITVCALLAAPGLAQFNPRPAQSAQQVMIDRSLTQQQKLTAEDRAAFDNFGRTVALSGDTAVVGAFSADIGANVSQGSVYVFTRSGGVWTLQQKLAASDGAYGDHFGSSVAISGDTVVVGARGNAIGANGGQGSAYVFTRSGGVWTPQQKLTANDGEPGDQFGASVAISGDTVVVGAEVDDIGGNETQGSAYVFTRSGGVWTEQWKLTANDGELGDQFGSSAAISGDTLVVGAYGDDIGANRNQGSAYVFVRDDTTWTLQQKLIAHHIDGDDFFGASVAVSGDTVVVGAPGDIVPANEYQGSAYVFARSGAVWTLQQQLLTSDVAANRVFGRSV